jgi:hypothetical protein
MSYSFADVFGSLEEVREAMMTGHLLLLGSARRARELCCAADFTGPFNGSFELLVQALRGFITLIPGFVVGCFRA